MLEFSRAFTYALPPGEISRGIDSVSVQGGNTIAVAPAAGPAVAVDALPPPMTRLLGRTNAAGLIDLLLGPGDDSSAKTQPNAPLTPAAERVLLEQVRAAIVSRMDAHAQDNVTQLQARAALTVIERQILGEETLYSLKMALIPA